MTVLALLPSPLLGRSVWLSVAEALRRAGHHVIAVELGGHAPGTAAEVEEAFRRQLPDTDLVLVPHSNAGLYVPTLIAARSVSALVFVDAAMPSFDSAVTAMAAPAFLAFLEAKADATGILPVWTSWWDEDLDSLFPNAVIRGKIEREQKQLPLSYFRSAVETPVGWDDTPCGYLGFGSTYADEVSAARRRGWPVTVIPGEHLEMIIHPAAVADAILALLGALDVDV